MEIIVIKDGQIDQPTQKPPARPEPRLELGLQIIEPDLPSYEELETYDNPNQDSQGLGYYSSR